MGSLSLVAVFSTRLPCLFAPATPAPAPLPAAERRKLLCVFLNNTACYLLAWLLVNFSCQVVQVRLARRSYVPGTWDLSGIHFLLPDSGWRRDAVLRVYGTGPLLVLALAAVAFGVFWGRQRFRPGLGKPLLLWLAFLGINQVFAGMLADGVTQSGWWLVPNWLANNGATWPGTVLGLVLSALQLLLGYLMGIPFLLAQDSHTILAYENRFKLIACALLGPWLAGSALLALSKLPHLGLSEVLHYAALGVLLVPLALGLHRPFQGEKEMLPRPTYVAWGLVGLALLGVLAWRLALGGAGVRI